MQSNLEKYFINKEIREDINNVKKEFNDICHDLKCKKDHVLDYAGQLGLKLCDIEDKIINNNCFNFSDYYLICSMEHKLFKEIEFYKRFN